MAGLSQAVRGADAGCTAMPIPGPSLGDPHRPTYPVFFSVSVIVMGQLKNRPITTEKPNLRVFIKPVS